MQESRVARAIKAATTAVSDLGLGVERADVVHNSNNLALRLMPCDTFARVAFDGREIAQREIELAVRLKDAGSPIAELEPRVEPRVYEHDGFAMTLWTFYESIVEPDVSPADYATTLERLHAGMRQLDIATQHFTDRVAEAQQLVENPDLTAALSGADRDLLTSTLRDRRRAIEDRGASEQLLHGEPHPGNVLNTRDGLRFIDLETGCRGPIEFDLAHVPEAVSDLYPKVDRDLLRECRVLVLAMVAAWRWDPSDELPNGERAGRHLISALRAGPPWPTLEAVMSPLSGP